MTMRVLITNGGAHPPEKWAEATAELLVPHSDFMTAAEVLKANKLRADVADALVPHHSEVQEYERENLGNIGHQHLNTGIEYHGQIADVVVARVTELAKGTPREAHFLHPQVQAAVRSEVMRMFVTMVREEREWHCHRNPDCANSRAWLKNSRERGVTFPVEG